MILRQSITVLRAGTSSDEYGNDTEDWTSPTQTVVNGCSVQPLGGTEYTVDRDAIVTRWRLYAPAGADIKGTDRVLFGGVEFLVDGAVEQWPSATGRLDHVECFLRRTDG